MSGVRTKGIALISGGSSGIGLACACELAARGYKLALIARNVQRLEEARDIVLKHGSPEVLTLSLDVIDEMACAKAVDHLVRNGETIEWLITCAGDVEPGLFETLGIDAHRRQFDLNYFGTLNLVAPVAGHMTAQGSGRIVLVSSAAAFVGIAGYSAYGASKFAIRGLGEALRVELAPYGVTCSVAFPPDTHTPQLARETGVRPEITARVASSGGSMSPQKVARKMIAHALKGRFVLAPSLLISLFGWTHSLYAPFFLAGQARLMRKIVAKEEQTAPRKTR
ncbi:MAG: SDR family oxidoreductase [Beijerinckiaceae bacterium]|nr:SDR family oxidoreductase [Beijerinckiaceae bacterium]